LNQFFQAIKGLLAARKGFRWSLYFVHRRDGLRYALHENAVAILLGYVLAPIENGEHIGPDWNLYLNFNWQHTAIKLEERYFYEENISSELWDKIATVDPGWMVEGGKPVFIDAKSNKSLPLGWAHDAAFQTPEERLAATQSRLSRNEAAGPTLGSVLRDVFREKGT